MGFTTIFITYITQTGLTNKYNTHVIHRQDNKYNTHVIHRQDNKYNTHVKHRQDNKYNTHMGQEVELRKCPRLDLKIKS